MKKDQPKHRRIRRQLDHPLAGKTGLVSEARAILYDTIGEGPHSCNWCGKSINWAIGQRGNKSDKIIADHLDNNEFNDSIENLVAACGSCNNRRMSRVGDSELFIFKQGVRHRAVERTCKHCNKVFTVIKNETDRDKGIYCSLDCMYKRNK